MFNIFKSKEQQLKINYYKSKLIGKCLQNNTIDWCPKECIDIIEEKVLFITDITKHKMPYFSGSRRNDYIIIHAYCLTANKIFCPLFSFKELDLLLNEIKIFKFGIFDFKNEYFLL